MNVLIRTLCFFLIISVISCSGGESGKNIHESKPKTLPPTVENEVKDAVEKTGSDQVASTVSPEQLAKAKLIIESVSADDIAAVNAKKKYKMLCATCHGFKGDMNVNGAKDLTISTLPLEESVAQVYHGKGLMTPFKGLLSEAEIVAVSKYIETLRQ